MPMYVLDYLPADLLAVRPYVLSKFFCNSNNVRSAKPRVYLPPNPSF